MKGEVLVEFNDGAKLVYAKESNKYIAELPQGQETIYETEIDAVQFLLMCGYYKSPGKQVKKKG